MTRLAVLADIHGNLPALEAVIADLQQFNVDHVIVAGDCINRGPSSAEVMERLIELKWVLMRGNNEMFLLDYETPRMPSDWVDYSTPRLLRATIPPQVQRLIAMLPDTLQLRFPDASLVRVLHGVPGNHWTGILYSMSDEEISAILSGVEEDTVIAAHTHLVMDRQVGRWHLLNPGSVGNPVNGVHDATYMILESHASGWNAQPRCVSYELQQVLAACEQPVYLQTLGTDAYLFIEELKRARPMVPAYQRWHREQLGAVPQTRATIEQFLQLGETTIEHYISLPYRIENLPQR